MERVDEPEFHESEWDETKRIFNLRKHGIDFQDAADALLKPHLEVRSDRYGEARSLAICEAAKRIIAVIYTLRDERRRIISARRASRDERQKYRQVFGE
jgi:uncharacterized DUF497 family protein